MALRPAPQAISGVSDVPHGSPAQGLVGYLCMVFSLEDVREGLVGVASREQGGPTDP